MASRKSKDNAIKSRSKGEGVRAVGVFVLNLSEDGAAPTVKRIRVRRPTARQRLNAATSVWRESKRARGSAKEEFEAIMEFARSLAEYAPASLIGLVRLLGLTMMSATMTQVLRQKKARACVAQFYHDFCFAGSDPLTSDGQKLEDVAPARESTAKIDMLADVILPWPWSRDRMLGALEELGPSGSWGHWKTDDNHQTELWLPMRVVFINGGNHSLTAGIALRNAGKMKAQYVRDVGKAIPHVRCDGEFWIRTCDDKPISKMVSVEMGAIWEIGRLMLPAKK